MDKPLVWLKGEIKTPPMSSAGRVEAGYLLRRLQRGEKLSLPNSRPMTSIAPRCHELRVRDERGNWRIVYRLDEDAIVVLDVFKKTTQQTPTTILDACRRRLREYDETNRNG